MASYNASALHESVEVDLVGTHLMHLIIKNQIDLSGSNLYRPSIVLGRLWIRLNFGQRHGICGLAGLDGEFGTNHEQPST